MYPTISDLLSDLFGINVPLPIQSFGFFVAISFLIASYTLSLELRRKERLGVIQVTSRRILRGAPATPIEIGLNAFVGFILGFKLVYFALNYSELVENPQQALLSSEGNILAGLVAAVAGGYMKYREKKKVQKAVPEWVEEKIKPHELVGNITIIAAITGLAGAKLFHNLEYPQDFLEDPIDALVSFSGLTMYGGLIGGAIGTIWYGKKNGIGPSYLCDAAAPGLMLGYGIGRIGCQIAGDGDWGIVNDSPMPAWLTFLPEWFWSYRYPHNVINEGMSIEGCTGKHCYILEYPVFPTPLYESVICIGLFFLLWSVRKKFVVPGKFFALFLLLNGIERFLIESIRVNSKYHFAGIEFTQAQLISLLLIITGITGLYFIGKKPKGVSLPKPGA